MFIFLASNENYANYLTASWKIYVPSEYFYSSSTIFLEKLSLLINTYIKIVSRAEISTQFSFIKLWYD